MKTLLLSVSCLLASTLAQAYTINWNSLTSDGNFTISNDFTTVGQGTLPPDNSQSVIGCKAEKPTLVDNGFTITCNGKEWAFTGSRFSCAAGGGGMWSAPDGSRGAYLCGLDE